MTELRRLYHRVNRTRSDAAYVASVALAHAVVVIGMYALIGAR